MADKDKTNEPSKNRQIQVRVNDDVLAGVYANNMHVGHTREEFFLDFLTIVPPAGKLVARVIVSPSHAKRIAKTLTQTLQRYEEAHGPIENIEPPITSKIVN